MVKIKSETWLIIILACLIIISFYFQSYVVSSFLESNVIFDILLFSVILLLIYKSYLEPRLKGVKSKQLITERDSTAFMLLFVAVVGRLLLKGLNLPSVEPVIPAAVLAGMTLSASAGFLVGSLGYILSNIFLGGIWNIWTFWQAIGGGIAGVLPSLPTKKEISPINLVIFSIVGTIIFELLINFGMEPSIEYMLTSLPYSLIHIVSNAIFAFIFAVFLPKKKEVKK